jgi:hypothetical protein
MAEPAKRGRPSDYTRELAAEICARLSRTGSLREVCRDEDMPAESTVRQWAVEDREGFYAHYAKAREIGYAGLADELLEIADDGTNDYTKRKSRDGSAEEVPDHEHINRSRLRVDTRKWLLSKVLPKVYGDRVVTEHTGPNGGPIQTEDVNDTDRAKALAAFMAKTSASKS